MKERGGKGVGTLRTRRRIRKFAGALAAATLIVTGGCGADLGSDPEALSVAAAEATYERDTETLYDYASPALRAYLGDDETMFGEAAEEGLEAEGLPEGGIDASGAQQASVLFAAEGLSFYDVSAEDPDGTDVTATVGLSGDKENGFTFCSVAVRPPGSNIYDNDAYEYVLGANETCGF